jgi:hypothetical protein
MSFSQLWLPSPFTLSLAVCVVGTVAIANTVTPATLIHGTPLDLAITLLPLGFVGVLADRLPEMIADLVSG